MSKELPTGNDFSCMITLNNNNNSVNEFKNKFLLDEKEESAEFFGNLRKGWFFRRKHK